ncbi:hypothetical protein DIC66_09460 [Rhodoferax lacus]|uniref:Outer membrane protein beta-barrel domain-containing protein n=1 Tax=Rhodoferax lacus TaxID=2184758 RepID=A0A3E1RDN5_9BURK|nr:outer membrane beta-barrel protein [Rhodoferax lacus]RFO97341.1 hypothetical protein DIC66_09460 [Rhodoferax lacus]
MKTISIAAFSVAALASSGICAQTVASAYEGLSVAINVNSSNVTVQVTDPVGGTQSSVSTADQNIVVQIAKGQAFGSNGVVNFGAWATLGDMKSASVGGLQLKATGSYGIYGELGYAIDRRSLAYAKLSYNQLTADLTGGGPGIDQALSATGFGYGGGYRHALGNGVYLQGELMQVNYAEADTAIGLRFKPSNTVGMVGVGYKF